ncbi:MAG: biosynthetic-type acetolactate synthase large subunit [Fusicatenibacter sp.]|nr:biosynthetic-type acetolactate synthase large subunit [Lachnospiraceae bacterium]MDY2938912.1 biosynthetic-type acetolactate synthase large subunit [Fusicatenibacter sp.]
MELTGSQIVIECLKEQGVDTVFGYPGGTILNIYDELYRHPEIHHILTSHEQGAAHAADGYARATGKVGVCMATSGPGATNLVTGIATAYMDSSPMVAITCNVGKPLLGKDSFQEIDIAGVAMPITKYSVIVKDISMLAVTLRRAFEIAKSGRPGPVLVDITKDVTAAKYEYEPVVPREILPVTETISEEAIDEVVKMIKASKKPYIFVGGGSILSGASEEVREFAHKIQSPVCDSLMGKGAFPGDDELYTGMLGMHGTKTSNYGVTKCDLLVVLGARFSDRVTGNASKFAYNAKIVQIDVDAAEINKNVIVDSSIIGDVKEVLKKLNEKLSPMEHNEWLSEISSMKERFPLKHEDGLTGPYVMEEIYRATNGEAVITTDVGQHQMWAAQYYRYTEPRTFISSGGLGTMGFGLGAAMGAKMGRPDKVVINIAGDGCFRMNMNELATLSRYNIPVIEVVINNHVLGMVRQWQTLFYGKRYSNTVLNDKADYVKVAEALGVKGIRVTKKEEMGPAIEEAINTGGPVLIDCQIDCDDKVFPMVPAGAPIEDAFDAEDLAKKQG